MIYFIHDLGLQCCERNICPVLKRETKENEKINLLSHKRVLYIGFSQLLPMLIVILVIIQW
jgi:hypothetical protein